MDVYLFALMKFVFLGYIYCVFLVISCSNPYLNSNPQIEIYKPYILFDETNYTNLNAT